MMMADRSSGSRCLLFDKLRTRLKTITMMKKLLLFLMMLAFVLPAAMAGEKTIVINRNEGIYDDGTGVYYCTRDGITMTFSDGLDNINYLVERSNKIFEINSTNFVIKKITFKCLDNTTADNLDCFYWGPSTMDECTKSPYVPTGSYTSSGYIGTWVGGSTPSKSVKFETQGKPIRFGSVEITIDKEYGDIYDLVTLNSQIEAGQTYALVSQRSSRALGKEEYHDGDSFTTFSSTPVTLLENNSKVKVTDEVSLIKLERAVSTTTTRPWHLKVGDNYIRRRNGSNTSGSGTNEGYNLYTVSTLPTDENSLYYYRVSISVENNTNKNALIKFYHPSGDDLNSTDMAIRHYNGGSLFRVMNSNSNVNSDAAYQRVYLYKPSQSYEVTTECIPTNGGYITLGGGVLTDDQGRNWSQHLDNVTFFVGTANGYGIGEVTITDINSKAVTVLQPTAASDFGNDYSFEMPANDVKITANFLQPYDIHTVINPNDDSGSIEFIDGYTDFNGQPKSNEGKTVTFKPVPADGYSFTSVTITDDVTGVTTTMTPDADGVYSFVMPGNSVTLTANFEEANDLYLLGTANGRTGWVPYGPKFTFDGVNEKYYIDVYFKGYNDDPNTDPAYGYFSLTKKISDPEHPNWDDLNGFRLAAETNQYWVADGYTGVPLYGDRPDNSFKIKPGVYRIEVNKEMTEMSIIEYPLTLTFDPAGGVPGNGVIVEPNTEVTISSNLQDLVHAINPDEDPVMFYNTIDNWATQENDNTRVISNIGETTVTGSAALGDYLIVNGAATYEIPGNLYLLGTANGNTVWYPHGPQFTFDEVNQEYYIDVYFKGDPTYNNNEGDPYGHFSLTTKISASDDGWGEINGYRLFATQLDYMVEDGTVATNCFQTTTDYAFKIPAGVYRITVNKAMNTMTITEYPLSLTFDPVSGSTVAVGDNVTISSNLDQLVHNINPNEVNASFKNSTDGGGTWDPDNTAAITAAGATTTVNAEAWIDYIIVPGTATYTTPDPTVYNITTQVNPEGSNAGTISAPGGSEADVTVNFTVTDADPAVYTLTGVEVVDSNNGIVASFEPSADGNYSFTMPNDDVTIHADYERTKYDVTTSWSPSEGGAIWLNGVNTPQTISVPNADQVVFGVAPATGYELVSMTVTNTATGQEITPAPTGNSNEYSFTMPASDVTVIAYFQLNSPLSYIERPGTYKDGDEVTVTDELIGTWVAKKYLWAKDQAPYVSNFYLEMNPENEYLHDYHREFFRLQYRDWDQSNWVMLDFSTIPELAGYSQQQLMAVVNNYVDNQIVAGSIKGTYRCVESTDAFGIYDGLVKVQHIIELSELPQYVKDPATIGPNNTLGYPGFQNDPQEKEGKYYGDPTANYAYNHYSPANFLLKNTVPDGVAGKPGVIDHEVDGNIESDYWFFMRPKDQEVVQVWAVWLGEMDYVDAVTHEQRTDGVFAVYNSDQGYNTLNFSGAFRVESWDYNINETDDNSKPTGYGEPVGELYKDLDYSFHAIVQYSPFGGPGSNNKAPAKAAVVSTETAPEFYNVYPLDLTSPEETYTEVKEVLPRDATTIVDIRYYNIMGQESKTPFDGINIMVVRYKDGSMISKKVLK